MARTVAGKGMMLTRVRCLFVFVITLFALDYAGRGITAWADAGGHGRRNIWRTCGQQRSMPHAG